MNPFYNRQIEWNELYQPLVGKTMLELGNKFNLDPMHKRLTYKEFFHSLGIEHTSVDLNGQNGALQKDLRFPLKLGVFDMVTNMGTSEHVVEQQGVWQNIAEATKLGGVILSATPEPGHWKNHGQFYPTLEFYQSFAELNGLLIEKLFKFTESEYRNNMLIGFRARRVEETTFKMPDLKLICVNEKGIMGIAE